MPETAAQLIASLESLPGDPLLGFFGPESITWRVNRESAVFLGAGRAALLQLAHPWVATALAHHSNLLHDAVGRFHSTFRVIYTMLFGDRGQATQAAHQLYRRHVTIQGPLPDGGHYEANDVAALRWVYATLVESALLAYDFALPPLSGGDREHYYQESKRMAALFGIPADELPWDWAAFGEYTAEMFDSPVLAVDGNARALGDSVLSGVGTWLRPPRWYRALTAFWMPPRLRMEFALPFTQREQQAVKQAAGWLPRVYRFLPEVPRYVGPYHEATARLRGRAPGVLTRRSNRFWMGQARMLYSSPRPKSDLRSPR
jgi:uncharacterized protein (DUF2236 family)